MEQPSVYLVILNWCGWKDTLECLESVFRLNYTNFKVIVCDNNSQDDSVDFIIQWANGHLNCAKSTNLELQNYTHPPLPKPIRYIEIKPEHQNRDFQNSDKPLILLHTGSNLGFAGGCNRGIQYALNHGAEFIWLLNNDTVISPESLELLVEQITRREKIGFISPEIYFYKEPYVKTGTGGNFSPLNPRFTSVTMNQKEEDFYQCEHVTGAAVLVRAEVIKDVGYMDESYFMYREETDWMIRASRLGRWEIGVAAKARIWHKIAASSGNQSAFQEYYNTRNTLRIVKQFYPLPYLWLICIYLPYRIGAITLKKGIQKFIRLKATIKGLIDHLNSIEGRIDI
jgi:GT2 family glycosyltransferase